MTTHIGHRECDVHGVVGGSATIYRLDDVGYEIDLARAGELLAPHAPPQELMELAITLLIVGEIVLSQIGRR